MHIVLKRGSIDNPLTLIYSIEGLHFSAFHYFIFVTKLRT